MARVRVIARVRAIARVGLGLGGFAANSFGLGGRTPSRVRVRVRVTN